MRAAIYARYSTDLQSRASIEDQVRLCQRLPAKMAGRSSRASPTQGSAASLCFAPIRQTMPLTTTLEVLWGSAAISMLIVFDWFMPQANEKTNVAAIETSPFRPQFSLADTSGQTRSNTDFRGKFLLVFFGFTNCPDICRTTLSKVASVMDDLGPDSARVQPLFISIDPKRDSKLGLADFTGAFYPAIIGLAGTEAEKRAAADSFRVYYERETDPAGPDGYTMSHSPALYVIGPEGDWLGQFSYGTPVVVILAYRQSRL